MNNWSKAVLIGMGLAGGLSGCAAVVLGGAAVGGLSAADRRTTGAQADDQMMELQIAATVNNYLKQQNSAATTPIQVKVVSYNRNVLLLGTVPTQADKDFAERVARAQTSVRQVYNHIQLAQERSFNDASKDTWITSKVRTVLLNPKGFFSGHVKVVTYNSITYALGMLTPEEQAAATAQISTTAGVQKVVTLYETFAGASAAPAASPNP